MQVPTLVLNPVTKLASQKIRLDEKAGPILNAAVPSNFLVFHC